MSDGPINKAVQAAGYYREVGEDPNGRRIVGNLLDTYNELQVESGWEGIQLQLEIYRLMYDRARLLEALESMPDVTLSFRTPEGKRRWNEWKRSTFNPDGSVRAARQDDDDE
jgi:hypothetical protein